MKTIFCIIISVLISLMSGCSNSVSESDMPDIVFEKRTKYEHDDSYSIVFIDKNGNYYHSDDSEINSLTNVELIEALKSGDERITKLSVTCDTDELFENYKKLLKVAANKEYGMAYSMEGIPAAESDYITWYGLYYDKDGKLVMLPIHEYRNFTEFNANDDRANEIFEWYLSAAKLNKNLQ